MLCVAKVNLSDWPEGTRREVDPKNETTQGLLRAGYIVPLRLPRRPEAAPKPPEAAPEDSPSPAAESREAPTETAERPRAKPKGK